jgi:aerobic-type carbon monoxide dehydrogenase small subunit (CoxS/CutS family)
MVEKEKKPSGDESAGERRGSISRREFAIGSIAVFSAGSAADGNAKTLIPIAPPSASHGERVIPRTAGAPLSSAAKTVNITVNGWEYSLQVEPDWVIRDVLRDQLGLLSIKDMCNGYGACGSCTIIMNGRPVLSCMTLAIECNGMKIETAESVAQARPDLIEAYVMNHCMQCGYCTPGFVVTAKALLDRTPNPTEQDIRDALGGNICRCGTYPQHLLAIHEATAVAFNKERID